MPAPTGEALRAAVNALYRVRATESEPDPEGLRTVWHRCAQGADLVSFLDRHGHVVRQELTLMEDYFLWTSHDGLVTGRALDPDLNLLPGLHLDPRPSRERLVRARDALGVYQGEDRYIRHIARLLDMVSQGLQSYDEVTLSARLPLRPAEASKPAPAGPRPRSRALALGIATALGLAGLVALWLRAH